MSDAPIIVRQAAALPLIAAIEFMAGIFAPEYSSMSQQLSELGARQDIWAAVFKGASILIGLSICTFAIGALRSTRRVLTVSSVLMFVFGLAMLSNGVFPMGSPMHGLLGLGLVIILIPMAAAIEHTPNVAWRHWRCASMALSIVSFSYLWLGLTGNDPESFSGLTQRIVMFVNLLWFAATAASWRASRGGA